MAIASVSPISPTTPSPETPTPATPLSLPSQQGSVGSDNTSSTASSNSSSDHRHHAFLHPDDPAWKKKGALAGWSFLALGLLGLVLAAGMASTDLFRPKRIER